ncbi:deoxyribodipyrimidine photo-lyase [Alishewanella longhuensis]|uniref:Cryptochrome DASH n=1 Tax=Alishewanella longhuensis TaxID=1091037 RepID=A0ABQ3L0Q9_9ALTE|nr:DASH family cryptochrome [Alishewanella longhuensis]GHG73948.1 deoxyribodipyrimidine photo-lyase [Alishewanella longhuensis]
MSTLVLLNHCLRLKDNPLLAQASGELCAVVTLEKTQFFGKQYGLHRANLTRLRQQMLLIADLKQQLAKHHIGLVTLFGNSTTELLQLAKRLKATKLLAAEPTAPEEYHLFQQLATQLKLNLNDANSLLANQLRPDLVMLSDRFTSFRKRLEPLLLVSAPLTDFSPSGSQQWLSPETAWTLSESWQQLTDFAPALPQSQKLSGPLYACESASWQRIEHYLWQQKHILHYKETRNGLVGENYASFFSIPLALGSLSVRSLWQQIELFEQQVAANDSTYWLKFELLWREFFRWQMRKYQTAWFSANGIKGPKQFLPPQLNVKMRLRFAQWCQGQTGVPFVDANMRLLNQSGLMSNRGRQNVASYLIHDLGLDWRLGAAYFEQRLLDYDVASNWGNWAYIAGYGNSEARPFNIIKQALSYDANADFVKQLLPEIIASGKAAHRPSSGSILASHSRDWFTELD